MKLLTVYRKDLQEVVIAEFRFQLEEEDRIIAETCERADVSWNCSSQKTIEKQVFHSLMVNPYIDWVRGIIIKRQFQGQIAQLFRENIKNFLELEESERAKKTLETVVNNTRELSLLSFRERALIKRM